MQGLSQIRKFGFSLALCKSTTRKSCYEALRYRLNLQFCEFMDVLHIRHSLSTSGHRDL